MNRIARIGLGGQGIAEDGTQVGFALPGELVDEGGCIVEPAPDRTDPPCRHFGTCGGCEMQHASDAFVATWKADLVRSALARRGQSATIAGVETSPPLSRRRAKFSGRRTKKGALVGFHERRAHQIVEVPECRVIAPALTALLPGLRELTREAASRKGEVGYQVTLTVNGPDLQVTGGKPLDEALRRRLAVFVQEQGLSRLAWEDEPVVTRLPPIQRFSRSEVVPPPGAFLQATKAGEAALLRAVRDIVGTARPVVDLFAGCGTFALPLAEQSEVHAVESDARMLAALDSGWRQAEGLKRVTTAPRDLFRDPLLPEDLARFGAAVVDPPRAGAEAQVTQIAGSGLETVAMVSCNPLSFARDAAILTEAGFAMGPVTVIDQFRWSAHVEIVAGFTRL